MDTWSRRAAVRAERKGGLDGRRGRDWPKNIFTKPKDRKQVVMARGKVEQGLGRGFLKEWRNGGISNSVKQLKKNIQIEFM